MNKTRTLINTMAAIDFYESDDTFISDCQVSKI